MIPLPLAIASFVVAWMFFFLGCLVTKQVSANRKPTERYFLVSSIIFGQDNGLTYSTVTAVLNTYPSLAEILEWAKDAVKDAKSVHVKNIMELNKEDFDEFRKGQNTTN